MIHAVRFNLDGALVQVARPNALSYARAAMTLIPDFPTGAQVIEAFNEVVDRSRQEVG